MINKSTYSKEWVNDLKENFIKADPLLIERVIMALTLLESLSKVKLDFIFKGGT